MGFHTPDASPFFSPSENVGNLIIAVAKAATEYDGEYGKTAAVVADVTIASGPSAGLFYADQVLINGPVVRELIKVIGKGPMLARLRAITVKGNTSYVLDPATADEHTAAEQYAPSF